MMPTESPWRKLALVLLGAWLSAALPAHGQPAEARRLLTVTGEGQAVGVPDQARITAGVVSEAATAADALTANTTAMNQVFAALRELGIAESKIQTADFSVQPVYAPQRADAGPQRISSYRVSNQVTVIVEEIAKVGTTLDALVRNGANQMHGIQFAIADPKPLAERARRAAVADAAGKARTIADAAGVRLGAIMAIEERSIAGPIPVLRMAQAEMAVPVAPGEQSATVVVTITYQID